MYASESYQTYDRQMKSLQRQVQQEWDASSSRQDYGDLFEIRAEPLRGELQASLAWQTYNNRCKSYDRQLRQKLEASAGWQAYMSGCQRLRREFQQQQQADYAQDRLPNEFPRLENTRNPILYERIAADDSASTKGMAYCTCGQILQRILAKFHSTILPLTRSS